MDFTASEDRIVNAKKEESGSERRRSPRKTTRKVVLIINSNGIVDGDTLDISQEGFSGAIEGDFKVGDEVIVYINNEENYIRGRKARVVRKIGTGSLGFEFLPEQ
jgi:hypothetical protein